MIIVGIIKLLVTLFSMVLPVIYIAFVIFVLGAIGLKKSPYLFYTLVVFFLSAPVLWIYSGYSSFIDSCGFVEGVTYKNSVIYPTKGIRNGLGRQTNALLDLVEDGTFECAEYSSLSLGTSKDGRIGAITRYTGSRKNREYIPVTSFSPSDCTNYYFTIGAPKAKSGIENAYRYTSTISIKHINNDKTLASIEEQIWGGGLIGFYRHVYAERKSGKFLACGYLSKSPHWWRGGINMHYEYSRSDKKFILSVLRPERSGGEQRINGVILNLP